MILSATKGLEISSNKIATEVIFDELKHIISKEKIGVMSGPNLSVEINEGKIALTTIAFTEITNAKIVQNYFYYFRRIDYKNNCYNEKKNLFFLMCHQ